MLRREEKEEFGRIYNLVKVAFQTAKHADGDEQDFVERLRKSKNYIPDLALVAEEKGELVGHIMLTNIEFTQGNQSSCALLLAPLCVALAHRRQGVGARLAEESLKLAKSMGHAVVFVVGAPEYYQRFGFHASVDHGIKNTNGFPDKNVMVMELVPHSLHGIPGSISFPT